MKSLFSILCLSFLSLTLTNCSLSPEQIASRLKPSNEVSLVSAKGVDYRKLRDLLKAKKWKEADKETRAKIWKVGEECNQDLGTIDKLWVKYSNGKFGFSVQKQIYQSLGGTKKIKMEDLRKFGEKVGWRKGGQWLAYSELTFSEKHYTGHLPYLRPPGLVPFLPLKLMHLQSPRNPWYQPNVFFLLCGDL